MNQEFIIRLFAFTGVLLVMLVWEWLLPRRQATESKWQRRANNLALVVFNTAFIRILLPVTLVGFAEVASMKGWGVFNKFETDYWTVLILSLLALDLTIYGQHVLFHKVHSLWRIHRVHHTDMDFDVTTGLRFHPVEILLSACIKLIAIGVLGAPALAVIMFEVVLNATSMFNHGNVYIPVAFDRWLRWIVVTPDMHRVHHSVIERETNSNYGFNLPWWDRLFGTYRPQPQAGHTAMQIGLDEFKQVNTVNVVELLAQPFKKIS